MRRSAVSLVLLVFLALFWGSFTGLSSCIRCEMIAQLEDRDITPPGILERKPLHYPVELQEQMIMGRVVLEVTVLPDSTIGYIEVKESVPELDSLAISNVSEWLFFPAYDEEEPVLGRLSVQLDFVPDTIIDEIAEPDTVYYDLKGLKQEIEHIVRQRQEPYKHSLSLINAPFFSENYHLISWQRHSRFIRRDAFTVIPSFTTHCHLFQNYYPFLESSYSDHFWSFRSSEYHLPVTFIDTYAGIGFMNMDYAHINLAKNNALNLDNLEFRTSLLFQDGYWMGTREKSSNFFFQLKYPLGSHRLHWHHIRLNQDIPPLKLRNRYEYVANVYSEENLAEHSLYWENPFLNIGLRYEESSFRKTEEEEQPERTLYQLLLERNLQWKRHSFHLGWEYFDVEETAGFSAPYLTSNHNDVTRASYGYEGERIAFGTELHSGLGFEYHTHSGIEYRLRDDLSAKAGLVESKPRHSDFTGYITTIIERDAFFSIQFELFQQPEHPLPSVLNNNRTLSHNTLENTTESENSYHDPDPEDIENEDEDEPVEVVENDEFFIEEKREFVEPVKSVTGERDFFLAKFDLGFGQREYRQYGLTYHSYGGFLPEEQTSPEDQKQLSLKTPYVMSEITLEKRYGVTDWLLAGWLQASLRNGLDYFPRWYGKANLECRYNLLHNNTITAGLIYNYTSDFYTPYFKAEATGILDGYIRISITRLFDIQADAKNLLGSDSVYGHPIAGIHWNVGIRWYFFN